MSAPSAVSGAPGERIELRIPASSQWVRVVRLTVAGVASRLPFSIDAVEDIKLAVAEAVNNAIQHATPGTQGEVMVTISLESDENGLWISVADEGRVSGDLNTRVAAPRPDEELPESGLGLLLIRSLMDEVNHQSGPHSDTVVKMFKRLPVTVTARG